MSFQDFRNRHPVGSIVEVDHTPPKNPYQCVDLPKDYFIEEFQMPNKAYGDAIDYWYHTAAEILEHFDKINGSNALAGDVVVLETNQSPIKRGEGDGHIGLATGNVNASQVEILEQNGSTGNGLGQGNDRIRTRWVPRTRVAGLLRPKVSHDQHLETVSAGTTWYLRQSPDPRAAIKGVVKRGDVYATQVHSNGWRFIAAKDGYVSDKAFATDPVKAPEHVEVITGAGKQYYLRSGPSTNDAQTGKVVRSGESYATEVLAGGWRKLTKDGVAGYVGPAAFR